MKKQKIIDLIIALVVWSIVSIPVHEFWHYWVGTWMGAKGLAVTYPDFLSGMCHFTSLPDHPWPIYIAGGVGTGIVMLLLAWRAWKSPTKWDWDDLFALTLIGGAQIGYGVAEVSLYYIPEYFLHCAIAGVVVGCLPTVIIGLPKMIGWISEE